MPPIREFVRTYERERRNRDNIGRKDGQMGVLE